MAMFWMGAAPKCCDVCKQPLERHFVDGKTRLGPWANMCLPCHREAGVGVGTGLGQQYSAQPDGRWKKTAG
jgi:hypothetical protein